MRTRNLFLVAALMGAAIPSTVYSRCHAVCDHPVGGPPRIELAGQGGGEITKAQWEKLTAVNLSGCTPDARVVSLRIQVINCEGKPDGYTGKDATLTPMMRTMVRNLPPGMAFTVQVEVKDGTGRKWAVPDAHFVWKG